VVALRRVFGTGGAAQHMPVRSNHL
jgi:hypothetical protein